MVRRPPEPPESQSPSEIPRAPRSQSWWVRALAFRPRSPALRYVIAAVSVATAAGLRALLGPLPLGVPLHFAHLAVLVSAWFGGLGPGLVTTAVNGLLVVLVFEPGAWTAGAYTPQHGLRLATFLLNGTLISVFCHALHQARQQLEQLGEARTREQVEQRLGLLLGSLRDYGICMLDPDGKVASWNTGAERLTGYRTAEALGRHFGCFFPAEEVLKQTPQRQLEAAALNGHVESEGWRQRKDGSRFWADVTLSAVRDAGDRLVGFAEVARDETQRHRAEEALRQTATRLAEAERVAHVGSWEWDLARDSVAWSAELRRIHGLPPADEPTPFEALARHVDAGDREVFQKTIERAREEGDAFGFEYRIRRPGGSARTLWTMGRIVRSADGHALRIFGTTQDITENRAAESERAALLRRQTAQNEAAAAERRAALLDRVGAYLLSTFDQREGLRGLAQLLVPELGDGCVIHVLERAAVRVLAAAVVDPARAPVATALEEAATEPPVPAAVTEAIQARTRALLTAPQDGIWRWLGFQSVIVVPLITRGRLLGVVSLGVSHRQYDRGEADFVEDLAERAALAIDNVRLFREAEEASRLKDQFLATLSHELRTPLNAIVGWAHLLATGELDGPRAAHAAETILRNAQAQSRLIADITDVSRIITGKLRLELRAVELAPIVDGALDSVRLGAGAKGIRLERQLDDADCLVSGDPERLQQVLWNLLANAIKFTPEGGSVRVRLVVQPGGVELAVEDTGAGIAEDFLPYVFERFRQADASTSRRHQGLGLGLAIVKHLVELHGGTVEARSAGPGLGATFVVKLPRRAPDVADADVPAAAQAADLPAPLARLDGLRVLAVDDDASSLELLDALLAGRGAQVRTARSVADALAQLDRQAFDLMLSDIEMPGEDGYALIEQLRTRAPGEGGLLPAIALTAYARTQDRARSRRAGFQAHLTKPFEPAELVALVSRLGRPAGGRA